MQTITEQAKNIIEQKIKNRLASTPFVDHSYVGNMVREYVTFGLTDPELLKAQGLSSDQWISVKDRWPTKADEDECQRLDIVCIDRKENKYFRSDSNHEAIRTIKNVVFWQKRTPLPSPPTDKQP